MQAFIRQILKNEYLELETGSESLYCTSCKADCGLCSGAFLYSHKAVRCDKCEMWVHNDCSLISESRFESMKNFDFHQPHIVAIQETKIGSSISTSELFPESCPYSVYRKDITLYGGGVMLLFHKDISHMHITELENNSESVWVKVFAIKTSHFVANWFRQPGGD